jgi:hypothetical protein
MILFPDNSQAKKINVSHPPRGIPLIVGSAITMGKHNKTFNVERKDLCSLFTFIACPRK